MYQRIPKQFSTLQPVDLSIFFALINFSQMEFREELQRKIYRSSFEVDEFHEGLLTS